MKSFNVLILSCDSSPLANTRAPHVLHRNIIRPVFVGLRVAIVLQKRQYTVRSHGSRAVNLLLLFQSMRTFFDFSILQLRFCEHYLM